MDINTKPSKSSLTANLALPDGLVLLRKMLHTVVPSCMLEPNKAHLPLYCSVLLCFVLLCFVLLRVSVLWHTILSGGNKVAFGGNKASMLELFELPYQAGALLKEFGSGSCTATRHNRHQPSSPRSPATAPPPDPVIYRLHHPFRHSDRLCPFDLHAFLPPQAHQQLNHHNNAVLKLRIRSSAIEKGKRETA